MLLHTGDILGHPRPQATRILITQTARGKIRPPSDATHPTYKPILNQVRPKLRLQLILSFLLTCLAHLSSITV